MDKWLQIVPVGQVKLIQLRKCVLPVICPFLIFRVSPPNVGSTSLNERFENVFCPAAGTGFHSHLILRSGIFHACTLTPLPEIWHICLANSHQSQYLNFTWSFCLHAGPTYVCSNGILHSCVSSVVSLFLRPSTVVSTWPDLFGCCRPWPANECGWWSYIFSASAGQIHLVW